MAGREELYLKHIDENTGRIAKALEYIVDEDKKQREQWAKEKEERAKREEKEAKQRETCRKEAILEYFALYYEENAVTEVERRKAKDLRRAVDNYISTFFDKGETE